ncbi:MAG: M16 family metallopeptidase [Anaeromyxobacteraceae bacterium]
MRRRTASLAASLAAPLAAIVLACGHGGEGGALRTRASPPLVVGPMTVALPAPSHPTVALRVAFRAGSVDDPPGKEGLTALTAAVLVEGGTEKLASAELARALFPLAAELSANVDKELTVLAGRCPRATLERFLPILEDVVLRPRFDPQDFERLRSRALDALEKTLRTEDDEALAKEALALELYRDHPYGHPTTGTVEALRRVTLEDVKAQWRRVFTRARLVVGVAGGYEDDLGARLARALAALPEGAPPAPVPPPQGEAPRFLLVEKGSTPTAISMGFTWDVKRGDPDFPALVVAVSALGEHRQGAAFRLFKELREVRGLNYGDYAYPEYFEQASGSALPQVNRPRSRQEFTLWLRPVEPQHRLFAVRAALREVDRWANRGLTAAELDRVRSFLLGYTLTFTQTDARRLGYAIDDRFYGLEPGWLETLRARLPALTVDEVNAAVRRHVDPARLRIVIATRGAAELASEIRSGAPSPITYAVAKPKDVLLADKEIERFPLGVRGPDDVRVVKVEELFER